MQTDMTALHLVETEEGMDFESLVTTVEEALLEAYRNRSGVKVPARVEVDCKTGEARMWVTELDEEGNALGDVKVAPKGFGRTAIITAESVIIQRFQEEEDKQVLGDSEGRIGRVVSGVIVAARNLKFTTIGLGDIEGVISSAEQAPGGYFRNGERIRVYVLSVARGMKGPHIELSRTHSDLVQDLFSRGVPEIEKGLVVIESTAHEPGHHIKVAVRALEKGVNPRGPALVRMTLGYEW